MSKLQPRKKQKASELNNNDIYILTYVFNVSVNIISEW